MNTDNLTNAVPVPMPLPFAPPTAPTMNSNGPSSAYPSYNRLTELDQNQISQLKSQGYTQGLIDVMASATNYFPLRIWVVDNSGSMMKQDGNRLISAKKNSIKLVPCTRWAEIQETINYHSEMAGLLKAPTIFRLMNNPGVHIGPQEFSIADKGSDPQVIRNDIELARRTMMKASPSGVTPLSRHVIEIRELVTTMMDDLNSQGKKVTIVLATDGLPTNETGVGGIRERNEFTEALRSLQGLPVWLVIRLCTDEQNVVDFYNEIDENLELSIEVLDDLSQEAEEVYEHNPWVNYSLPLHRMREMGNPHRLFDLLDERKFTRAELRDFCFLLFGAGNFDGVPDPEVDFTGFLKELQSIMSREEGQWNPVKKKVKPLLDLKEMNRIDRKSVV